jgi:hypothetical protein
MIGAYIILIILVISLILGLLLNYIEDKFEESNNTQLEETIDIHDDSYLIDDEII